jgi:outer membrane protein
MRNYIMIMTLGLLFCAPSVLAQHALTLDECRHLALRNNAVTVTSALELEAARQQRKTAFTKYFPSIDAGGMYFSAQKDLFELRTAGGNLPVYDGNPAHIPSATQFAYMPSSTMSMLGTGTIGYVDVVQPVFAGGRIVNGNRLAALGVEVRELRRKLASNETASKTEEHYWNVITLREKSHTLDRYEQMLTALQGQVADAFRSGLVLKNDLLKVELKLNEIRLSRSKLESGRTLALMALCQYIGIPYDSTIALTDTLPAAEDPRKYFVDHDAALVTRAEYALLGKSVEAGDLQTRMTRGEYLPSLAVGVTGRYIELDRNEGRTLGAVFGTLSVPLSGWWGGAHDIEMHAVEEDIARVRFRNNAELMLLELEKAWLDLSDAYRQIRLSVDACAQAEEQVKVNQDSYDSGVSTLSDLLDAQAEEQRTRDQLTEARAKYQILLVTYLQMTGR